MRTRLILTLLLISPLTQATGLEKHAVQARTIVEHFGDNLKATLSQAMQQSGPVAAIGVCSVRAPELAMQATDRYPEWEVGRTSLKARNPNNRPDDWERTVLNEFELKKSEGTEPRKLEFYEIIETAEGSEFRYMKAIPTGQVCLACHGQQIAEPVKARLHELYPEDRATGYRFGMLRGAFSLRKSLPREEP